MSQPASRPITLITGVSRRVGIGAAIALALAERGWDIAATGWTPYDAELPWGSDATDAPWIRDQIARCGVRYLEAACDLADPEAPTKLFDRVNTELGPVTALIMAHCYSVDSGILDTTMEAFDQHFAVNARASWLLIREMGRRYAGPFGAGRVISLTSDAVVGNVPYGASKGALDRITVAAAQELGHLGITANALNPGPTDNGWMTDEQRARSSKRTPLGRVSLPSDTARLVAFLCSAEGGWVNGQLLKSNGGFS
jgi:3-oxoacyl-[acyl-carrier protein] reductase